ncbi:polysaccharide export protein [Vibrio sp. Sgm 5]|uniref:polysaccharide export protein n=1 Tax=Vibrio sp. Sgm 5 TaxID=2994387 RepID=UPI00224923B5|nr:polysaccharide export protein [Vibrio sp. Sgm 5]MCX2792887.1 polysaccharide export protein [Vibrio sp. Sgm 5]
MNKLALSLIAVTILSGCSVTGSHLETSNKTVIESKNNENELKYNLFPLTPQNVNSFNDNSVVSSTTSQTLRTQIANYEYKIGVGDILNVTVYDHPELTTPAGSYRSASDSGNWVHSDGTVFYPYIGKVQVVGKTVSEVRDVIAVRLAQYIEKPQVDVSVASFRSQKVYVTGEIKNPNHLAITNIPLTVLDAVNKAGGLKDDADWRNVTLTRDGKETHISLYALMQNGDLTQNHLLKDNDIIHVPRDDAQKVFVMGEVLKPDVVKIDRAGLSLTEALSSVGGINELSASSTGIFVIRKSTTENVVADIYQLDLSDASSFVLGTEFELQPYDTVYVTDAPITRWNRLISQLLPTISGFNELSEGVLRVRNW